VKKTALLLGALASFGIIFVFQSALGIWGVDWAKKQATKGYKATKKATYDPVKKATYDPIKKKADELIAQKRDAGKKLVEGGKLLAAAPNQLRKGAQELAKLPAQLREGARKITAAINDIHASRKKIKQQRDNIQKQKLKDKGFDKLEATLLSALNSLDTALKDLANTRKEGQCMKCTKTDAAGKCIQCPAGEGVCTIGERRGVLCNFLIASNNNAKFATKQVAKINQQINVLDKKITGQSVNVLGKKLPTGLAYRMEKVGATLAK